VQQSAERQARAVGAEILRLVPCPNCGKRDQAAVTFHIGGHALGALVALALSVTVAVYGVSLHSSFLFLLTAFGLLVMLFIVLRGLAQFGAAKRCTTFSAPGQAPQPIGANPPPIAVGMRVIALGPDGQWHSGTIATLDPTQIQALIALPNGATFICPTDRLRPE
jgi:hypothetical protein